MGPENKAYILHLHEKKMPCLPVALLELCVSVGRIASQWSQRLTAVKHNQPTNLYDGHPSVTTKQCRFFFFCGRSAVLRPSVHMLPGIGWCGAGLQPFPTACWWLTHPCGHNWCLCFCQMGQSWRMRWTVCFASLQSQSAESMMPIRFRCAGRAHCPVRNLNIVVCSCLARRLIGSVEGL